MLKEKYKDYFKVGTAVNNKTIISHADLITTHFNCLTCENEMKYSSVAIDPDQYVFNNANQIVEFAKKNNMPVRGHTFVWHNQTPAWVFTGADRQQLLQRIKSHISTIGGRYKDQIFCWDVVNEAIEDRGSQVLRDSKWREILGDSYMDEIFHIAREVLPEAQLFYNDYNETNPEKQGKIFKVLKGMKERDVPVDGIGMQCHNNIFTPSADELKKTIEKFAQLSLRIHITEMDVSLFEFGDRTGISKPSPKLLEKQAKVYEDSFKVFREYKDHIDCVTLWGVADDVTWLDNFPVHNRKNWPLLFDENHNPKEALYRILNF